MHEINSNKIIAIKPLTYMNNSGEAVGQFVKFYKIPLENIIVIHDELDIATGKVKTKIQTLKIENTCFIETKDHSNLIQIDINNNPKDYRMNKERTMIDLFF